MSSDRKFYSTTFTHVVLSEFPLVVANPSLAELAEACDAGPCVLKSSYATMTSLTPKKAADALIAAGSEPGFFMLDEEGNDTNG